MGHQKLKLYFVTQNEGKLAEARQYLRPLGIEVEGVSIPLLEPGEGTVKEISRIKLEQAIEAGYDRVMVDDAGIYLEAYPAFPGVLSKRIFHQIGYRGIRKLLEGESRKAWFEGAISISWNGKTETFTGVTRGRIIQDIRDDLEPVPEFPFDPIFIPDGADRVMKEMPLDERLSYSYRRKALEKLAAWLLKETEESSS